MTSSYVLDTCVLLADPRALYRFEEHEVVLPLVVVEELDRNKTRMDEVGRNARTAVRLIEELRERSGNGLREPVQLPGGGTLRVEGNHVDTALPAYLDPLKPDHRILAVALGIRGTLVSKDGALRIKGSQLGVDVEDYRADTVQVDEHYTGLAEIEVDSSTLDTLHRDGKVVLEAPGSGRDEERLWVNQCLVLKAGRSASGLARVAAVGDGTTVVTRVAGSPRAFGVTPRDVRQTFALDLLIDPAVPCVSLMGMAGTGKTFLALAAGLEQVLEARAYRRLSVYRPLVAVGRQDVGYLPGALEEKLSPWMAAVHDNLYSLFRRDDEADSFGGGGANQHRDVQEAVDALLERGQLEMAAITYLRGRSITDEYVIVDEAQNLELPTLKVILTRMAHGSKVVFCGDLSQVDNPYISPYGGMAALIEKLKGTPLFGHVTMSKGVRSPLAELAATRF
ncbi:MAG: PhoH family protein [Nitriliruptorales bacterium]|nr:PhoH family protein [Nitriliruptorales bacterium]